MSKDVRFAVISVEMGGAPCRVVVVVLGDSHAGKTALVNALTTGTLCDPSQSFSPTVGAESSIAHLVYHGRTVELVLWDCSGAERFAPPLGTSTVEAHVCCLVADLTDRASLSRLAQWRDEFAQASPFLSAPAFVVVGTKADVADLCDGRREVSRSDLEFFAAAEAGSRSSDSEKTDFWWPRQAAGTATPVPPVFEVSSASQASRDTAIAELKEQLVFRGLVTQAASVVIQSRIDELTAGSVTTRMAYNTLLRQLKESAVTVALHGPAAPPLSLFNDVGRVGVLSVPKDDVRPWNMMLWHSAFVGTSQTPEIFRLMRAVVLLIDLSETTTKDSAVRLLQEDYLRQANLRDPGSIVWVVMGVSGEHKAPAASERLSLYCKRLHLPYMEAPWLCSEAMVAEMWAALCRAIQEEYVGILMRRTDDQLQVAATSCPNGACSWVGRAVDVEQHLTTCPKQVVQCRWDRCTHVSFRDQRETHEKFCVLRPATCHFCEQAYSGTLVDHLTQCLKRDEFERSHVACPMADYGCPTTHVPRGELRGHLGHDVPSHLELLCAATTNLRRLLMEQERRHMQSVDALRCEHQKVVADLTLRLEDTQAVARRQHDSIVEMGLEFKLVWEELQQLRRGLNASGAA